MARADATIRHGGLITKTDAIEWLRTQDLPPGIVDGVAARRAGEQPELGAEDRTERATVVRSFLRREIARLV